MRAPVLALAFLALTSSGCVNGFICSHKGGVRWREVTTDHFVLRTNHGPETARALALELERIRDALANTLVEGVPSTGPRVQVVISRSPEQFRLFSPAGSSGVFTISLWGDPTILLPPGLGRSQRMVIAHELTHMLTSTDLARQPRWYREGLATYAETVQFAGDDGKVMMGDVSFVRSRELPMFLRGTMRSLLTDRDTLRAHEYALAWVLVHFLVTEHSQRLGELEDRFARGEDPRAAWRAVFPEWDPDASGGAERLEDALSAYVRRPTRAYVYPHRALASIPPPSERILSSAESHDIRLSLRWVNQGRGVPRERLLVEAREAVEEDPGSPTAVALLAAEPGVDARALAERATRARPQDARNWVLLGEATPEEDTAAREAAFRRAVATDPESAPALLALVRFLLREGRAKEALPPVRRCVELAPWSPTVLDAAAEVLEAAGDCARALALEERAIDALGDHAPDDARRAFLGRRDRLRGVCGTATAQERPRYLTPNSPRTTAAIAMGY